MWVTENGQEWQEERKWGEGRTEGKRGSEGDRQRFGPTYNREHERAQNVPQGSPGDGRDRRHHALEPRQPTLTTTVAIHTHTHGPSSYTSHRHSGTWNSNCSIVTVKVLWWNWNPSFAKLLWVWAPLWDDSDPQHSWLFTASGLQKWKCIMLLIAATLQEC